MYGTCGCERRQMFVCDAGIHVSRNFSSRVSREPKGNRRVRSKECPAPPPPPSPYFFGAVHYISIRTVEPPQTHQFIEPHVLRWPEGNRRQWSDILARPIAHSTLAFSAHPPICTLKRKFLVFLTVRKYIMGSSLGHHSL